MQHLLLIQHACAAVDDQAVGGEVLREGAARGERDFGFAVRAGLNPSGNFHGANVLALAVVRTALGDEDLVALPEVLQGGNAEDLLPQIALVPGHEDGERGGGNVRGRVPHDEFEGLRVGHDQRRRLCQSGQGLLQVFGLDAEGIGVAVEQLAQDHLLRQDDAPFRGRGVNGNDEHHGVAGRYKVAENGLLLFGILCQGAHALLEFVDAGAGNGTDKQGVGVRFPGRFGSVWVRALRCAFRQQVSLVADNEVGELPLLKDTNEFPVGRLERDGAVGHKDGKVGLCQDLAGPLHALFPERSLVVEARGVNDDDRANGEELHRLLHGVRGGAADVGDDGKVLAGHRVDHAGLAGVADAEEPDVDALARRGLV